MLASVFLLIMEIREWYRNTHTPPLQNDFFTVSNLDTVAQDRHRNDMQKDTYKTNKKASFSKEKSTIRFHFDPNRISSDSLRLLGFSNFASRNLVNFVAKGGRIYDQTKLLSIYGVDSILVNELAPWIQYPLRQKTGKEIRPNTSMNHNKWRSQRIVDLNKADSLQLDSVPGIGPYTAAKIIKMRNRLGGYISVHQLQELQIISDSSFVKISEFLMVSKGNISHININKADYQTFVRHPYFSRETASAILKYRKQHGAFTNVSEISRIMVIPEEIGAKIKPYLAVLD
jgi:competence protein ComEA